jgi:hypothetical protein
MIATLFSMIRSIRYFFVLCPLIKMPVKRPNRPVTEGTGEQTEGEQVAQHVINISVFTHNVKRSAIIPGMTNKTDWT